MFVYLLFLMVVVEKCWNLKQREVDFRVRVMMCNYICHASPGCKRHLFAPEELTCTLLVTKCQKQLDSQKQCGHLGKHLSLKYFIAKSGQSACKEIDVKDAQGDETDLERTHISSKYILAGLQSFKYVKMFLYDPDERSFLLFNRSCKCGLIRSLVYVKNRAIVLLAEKHSRCLKVLKENRCSTARKGIICTAMELHHQQQRVYIASATNNKICFYTVAPDGTNQLSAFQSTGHRRVNGMALDEHHALIYVSTDSAIISFTERGTQMNKHPFQSVGIMHLDYTGSTLYYVKGRKLFELNTLTNGSRLLDQCSEFSYDPESMEWFRGRLFLTFVRRFIILENETCNSHEPPEEKAHGLYFAS